MDEELHGSLVFWPKLGEKGPSDPFSTKKACDLSPSFEACRKAPTAYPDGHLWSIDLSDAFRCAGHQNTTGVGVSMGVPPNGLFILTLKLDDLGVRIFHETFTCFFWPYSPTLSHLTPPIGMIGWMFGRIEPICPLVMTNIVIENCNLMWVVPL